MSTAAERKAKDKANYNHAFKVLAALEDDDTLLQAFAENGMADTLALLVMLLLLLMVMK